MHTYLFSAIPLARRHLDVCAPTHAVLCCVTHAARAAAVAAAEATKQWPAGEGGCSAAAGGVLLVTGKRHALLGSCAEVVYQ